MAREVKRVALDFIWEMGKVWSGFVNPYNIDCPACHGSGQEESGAICQYCSGVGVHPTFDERYNAWEEEEPPTGDGWQLWEDVTEGSPISPVFATKELLARWLSEHGERGSGRNCYTYETWLAFLGEGYAPSFVMANGGFMAGVEYVALTRRGND